MKIEIEYKDNEYVITLNNKQIFNWKNPNRILREVRKIMDNNEHMIRRKGLR